VKGGVCLNISKKKFVAALYGGPDHLLLLEIYNEHFKKERSKTLSKIILGSFETPKKVFFIY